MDFRLAIRWNSIVERVSDALLLHPREVFSTASGDLDGDGDIDVLLGMRNGTVRYFQKESNGDFSFLEGAENPFNIVDVGTNAIPMLVQLDSDADLEVLIDGFGGDLVYLDKNANGEYWPTF